MDINAWSEIVHNARVGGESYVYDGRGPSVANEEASHAHARRRKSRKGNGWTWFLFSLLFRLVTME